MWIRGGGGRGGRGGRGSERKVVEEAVALGGACLWWRRHAIAVTSTRMRSMSTLHHRSADEGEQQHPPPAPTTHDFHWFVGTPHPPLSWPSRVEVGNLLPAGCRKRDRNHVVTLFERGQNDVGAPRMMVFSRYGTALMRTHDMGDVDDTFDMTSIQTHEDLLSELTTWTHIPPNESFVFVCAHNARDTRCGIRGTAVLDALRHRRAAVSTTTSTLPHHIYACSHVGGHKWAANVLRASPKLGIDWFSQVDPASVADVDHILSLAVGSSIPGHVFYRGNSWAD